MSSNIVRERMNVLRSFIGKVTDAEREDLKISIDKVLSKATKDALRKMKSITPVRRDDSQTYEYRQIGWEKYGEQSYLKSRSIMPSERQHGITLKDGWVEPKIDFIGTNQFAMRVSATILNSAPHAGLAINGEYRKSSWTIPKGDLEGGRKLMLWSSNGNPVFRWVAVNTNNANTGPVTFKRPNKPLDYIPEAGKEVLLSYSDELEDTIRRHFRNARVDFN